MFPHLKDQGGYILSIYSGITFLVVKRNELFRGIEQSVGVGNTVLRSGEKEAKAAHPKEATGGF